MALCVLGQELVLQIREFDVQVFVQEQVGRLDVAVEGAMGVDPADGLGGLTAPGQPQREGERLA
ncbi:13f25ac6-6aed-46cb-af22-520ed2f74462 [Thermothielavioides terrestris]|uniref:13f25ac6-6aed-46cb-af22-520ed2f74462 n=1 Tax=Thermothielavioides terrestris TaxID=2587410 RepID=A0A3S4EZX2_9PEZI|nr:13f25ac6-6aed-46cb-af22-520ed2f74462 [Thermothielavioides terrestris]